MIYLDTSVALAYLLGESRAPSPSLWSEHLVSSRLLEYELWARVHGRAIGGTHGELVRELLGGIALLELATTVLARALEPFPTPVRTLDALHLASLQFVVDQGQEVALATYDARMEAAARAMGIQIWSDGPGP